MLQDLRHAYSLTQFPSIPTFNFPYRRKKFIIQAAIFFFIIFVKIANILEILSMEIRYYTFVDVPMVCLQYRLYRQTAEITDITVTLFHGPSTVQVVHSNLHM